jgi:hypothetical protein
MRLPAKTTKATPPGTAGATKPHRGGAEKAREDVERVDFRKLSPQLYRASEVVTEVRVPRATFLAVDGVGAPGGEAYQQALEALFALAYTAKFTFKRAGLVDFVVPPLECLYFDDPESTPRDQWRWRLLLRIPDVASVAALKEIRTAVAEGKGLDTTPVRRFAWAEGRALQVLHVGPYDDVGDAFKQLAIEADTRGLVCQPVAHEIYLSDPRRVAPEKLTTIVRVPVRPPRVEVQAVSFTMG